MDGLTRKCLVLALCLSAAAIDSTGADTRDKRDDEGVTYKVTTIVEPPYLIEKDTTVEGNDRYEGFIPDLMKAISKKIDDSFNYEFQLVADGKYGAKSNGQWNGMIKEILDAKADMAAAAMTIADERKEAVDFTEAFMNFGTVLLVNKPSDGTDPPVTEIEQLADQSAIKYGVVKNGESENFFRNSDVAAYKKMSGTMSQNAENSVNTVKDGVTRVRNSDGKYAFIMESVTADYWANMEPCNLKVVGDKSINRQGHALAVRKSSALRSELSDAISQLKEDGTIEDLRNKWWKGQCSGGISHFSSNIATHLSTLTMCFAMVLFFVK